MPQRYIPAVSRTRRTVFITVFSLLIQFRFETHVLHEFCYLIDEGELLRLMVLVLMRNSGPIVLINTDGIARISRSVQRILLRSRRVLEYCNRIAISDDICSISQRKWTVIVSSFAKIRA